ncbi:MAG: hypothetical protein EOP92_23800, partial [Lysobacteraceae bacterium]
MSLINRLFGLSSSAPAHSQLHAQNSQMPVQSQAATRRELLRVVLRDTLIKHGIPTAWVTAEIFAATGGGREIGVHLRLLLRHTQHRDRIQRQSVSRCDQRLKAGRVRSAEHGR